MSVNLENRMPATGVHTPWEKQRQDLHSRPKGILNNEQLDTLMAAIRQDELWHDFFYTELTTGLRRGELCGLKWEDFDSEAGTLKICRTILPQKGGGLMDGNPKTYAGKRTILLPHSTAQLLRERRRTALTEWIFPDLLKPENPTHPGSAYRQLKKLLSEAGLPDIRFHDLRHPNVKPKTQIFYIQSRNPRTLLFNVLGFLFCKYFDCIIYLSCHKFENRYNYISNFDFN